MVGKVGGEVNTDGISNCADLTKLLECQVSDVQSLGERSSR